MEPNNKKNVKSPELSNHSVLTPELRQKLIKEKIERLKRQCLAYKNYSAKTYYMMNQYDEK